MTDTIDRLVRMLDEERRNAREVRSFAADKEHRMHGKVRDAEQRLELADEKITEWASYADELIKLIPERKRQALPRRPGPRDEPIPF